MRLTPKMQLAARLLRVWKRVDSGHSPWETPEEVQNPEDYWRGWYDAMNDVRCELPQKKHLRWWRW